MSPHKKFLPFSWVQDVSASIPKYHGVLVYPEVLCLEMACGRPVPLASTPGKTGFDAWSLKGLEPDTIFYHQIPTTKTCVLQENQQNSQQRLPQERLTYWFQRFFGYRSTLRGLQRCTVGGSSVSLLRWFWWTQSCNNRQSLKAI